MDCGSNKNRKTILKKKSRDSCPTQLLNNFIRCGVYRENTPRMYIYRVEYEGEQQTSILCGVHYRDIVEGRVKPHEKTLQHRKDKIKAKLKSLGIFSTAPMAFGKMNEKVTPLLSESTQNPPILDVKQCGVRHQLF